MSEQKQKNKVKFAKAEMERNEEVINKNLNIELGGVIRAFSMSVIGILNTYQKADVTLKYKEPFIANHELEINITKETKDEEGSK